MEDIGFLTKKIISVFLYPMGFATLLLLLAILTLLLKKSRFISTALVSVATLILIIFSLEITSYHLVRSLEDRAGPFQTTAHLEKQGVKYIVVLGGALVEDGGPPAEAWGSNLLRVMEGVRLSRGIKNSRLVLSGSAIPGRYSHLGSMLELPLEMGISRDAIIALRTPYDTDEGTRELAGFVENQPFGLVTSALHMPRAVKMFERFGTKPIPCPCDFRTLKEMKYFSELLPKSANLYASALAIHEYIGMLWMDVVGIFLLIRN